MSSNNQGQAVVHVANAPVSYGAFELTVGIDPDVPSAAEVLDAIAGAGYEGVDLGPVGYFGKGEELSEALTSRGLKLAGGYLEADVVSEDGPSRGVADLMALMECFDAVSEDVPAQLRPRPTIALVLQGANPADQRVSGNQLWDNAERVLAVLTATSRERGYEPCLHNELGTLISSDADIARAMDLSDISLCLDTGHYFAGGGDPLAALETWGDRLYQVHIKDSHREPYDRIVAAGKPISAIWSEGVFCRLGDGETNARQFLEALLRRGFSGWLIVEQDILPTGAQGYAGAAEDQRRNRAFLSELGM
jgi:inosose dehydratase